MIDNVVKCKKISRWPKKREFLAYYLIYKEYGDKEVNIGNVIDLLIKSFCVNRKTAINIIDHLARIGFVERTRPLYVRCLSLNDILDKILCSYIESRKKRCKR